MIHGGVLQQNVKLNIYLLHLHHPQFRPPLKEEIQQRLGMLELNG
jgi:hypothetical protein